MVRSRLIAGGGLASAGILAVSLVVVTPSAPDGATIAVRSEHVTSVAFSSAMPPAGLLEQFRIGEHTGYLIPVNAFGTGRQVNNATLATTSTGIDLVSIIGPLINNPVVGPLVLVGAIGIGFLVILPVAWAVGTAYEALAGPLGLPPTLPLPGTVTATAAVQTLEATPSDPVGFLTENAQILADGLGTSANNAALALAGEAVLALATVFLSVLSPPRIPTVLLVAAQASDSIWTGALNTTWGLGYDQVVPGFYIPTDVKPTDTAHSIALQRVINGAVLPATVVAVNQVAVNLTEAGVPAIFEQALLSSEKIGVTVFQAGVLVRSATVLGVQEPILAASEGGDVAAAIQTGATQVQEAVFGDPDAPDVHVDPYDNTSPTAPSMAQLGAIGSVTTVVQQAVGDTTGTLTPSGSASRVSLTSETQMPLPARDLVKPTIGEVKSAFGKVGTTAPANQKRPVRDTVTKAVTQVRDSLKKTLGGNSNGGTP